MRRVCNLWVKASFSRARRVPRAVDGAITESSERQGKALASVPSAGEPSRSSLLAKAGGGV